MRLNQVTLSARNLAESIAFYRKLGLRLIVEAPHYARFECPDGEATFSLHLDEGFAGGRGAVVYFEHDVLDVLVEELKARGIVFDSGPQDQSWLWREAYLTDPAGNRICLYQAGTARRYPPWRLGGSGQA
jgi:catechol 2,3-dioxygenase-like lactoylglutathione lyase family enzyme